MQKRKDSRRIRSAVCLMLSAMALAACTKQAAVPGSLRLAVVADYRPYVYEYKGELTGIDIDIAKKVAGALNRKLEIVEVNYNDLIESVKSNKADMAMTALAVTEERRKHVDFSDPYEFDWMTFVVRSDENILHLPDLCERTNVRVGAETGSTGYEIIAKEKGMNLVGYTGNRGAVADLLDRRIDAVVLDHMVAVMLKLEYPNALEMLADKINHEEFAVAVTKKDLKLLKAANEVVHQLWESGELHALQQKHARQALDLSRGTGDTHEN